MHGRVVWSIHNYTEDLVMTRFFIVTLIVFVVFSCEEQSKLELKSLPTDEVHDDSEQWSHHGVLHSYVANGQRDLQVGDSVHRAIKLKNVGEHFLSLSSIKVSCDVLDLRLREGFLYPGQETKVDVLIGSELSGVTNYWLRIPYVEGQNTIEKEALVEFSESWAYGFQVEPQIQFLSCSSSVTEFEFVVRTVTSVQNESEPSIEIGLPGPPCIQIMETEHFSEGVYRVRGQLLAEGLGIQWGSVGVPLQVTWHGSSRSHLLVAKIAEDLDRESQIVLVANKANEAAVVLPESTDSDVTQWVRLWPPYSEDTTPPVVVVESKTESGQSQLKLKVTDSIDQSTFATREIWGLSVGQNQTKAGLVVTIVNAR